MWVMERQGGAWLAQDEHAEGKRQEAMLDVSISAWMSTALHKLTTESTFLAPVCSYGPFHLETGKTLIPTADQGQSIAVFGAN